MCFILENLLVDVIENGGTYKVCDDSLQYCATGDENNT
jgi:hypothetical protein